MTSDLLNQAKRFAVRSLAKKSQPSTELRQRLQKRDYPEEIISDVIGYLIGLGYVNDEQWLAQAVQQLVNKGYGTSRIREKLFQKGIAKEKIEEAILNFAPEELFCEQIHHLLKTRYKNADLSDYKQKQKVIASLARRGFSLDTIFQSLGAFRGQSGPSGTH